MDLAPSHKDIAVLDYMKQKEIKYFFIFGFLIRYPQKEITHVYYKCTHTFQWMN